MKYFILFLVWVLIAGLSFDIGYKYGQYRGKKAVNECLLKSLEGIKNLVPMEEWDKIDAFENKRKGERNEQP